MPDWFVPLLQVLMIDIVLAGDNAIVVGMAAAGLPPAQRRTAILWGIGAAPVMRIGFGHCGNHPGGRCIAGLGLLEDVP